MKVSGNYSSIVRGVSQQAPADRLDGQHGEVLNMLSDPVRGLVRRNGMVLEDQTLSTVTGDTSDATADSFSFRTYSYLGDNHYIDLIYRSRAKVGSSGNHLAGLLAYDKTPGVAAFIPVVSDPSDVNLPSFLDGGISAVVNVGEFVLLAGRGVTPTYSAVDQVNGQTLSNAAVAWVRGGVYARQYVLYAQRASDGATFTASYTTKQAAYPGSLTTSDLDYAAADYQKQVNDRTYAYNASVNQWIADASADIVPSNIAQKLIDSMTSQGFTGWTRNGAHIGNSNCSYIHVDDNGDGSLLVALRNETSAVDEVTDMHYAGKVIKVQPKTASDKSFYLKAQLKDGAATGTTGLQPVVWREAAGTLQTPTLVFAFGMYHKAKFYVASSASALHALILSDSGDSITVPDYVPSASGDTDSAPPPHFFGRTITALAVFQDRLVVASGNTVNLSRVGDYLNFYRTSALTLADDDTLEVYAIGTEGDTIRQATLYDHSLFLGGEHYQYMMNGRVVQTPTTAYLSVQFTIANTDGARPQATGQYIFWLKEDTQLGASRLLQVKQGVFQDSPQMDDVSRQLRDYVNGTPAEMVVISNPEIIFVRTEHFLKSEGGFPRARPWGLYVYQFMDGPDGQRIVDAWSAWEWSTTLGTPIGVTALPSADGIMLYTVAWGHDENGTPVRGILAQSASARPDPTGLPYLDGMRPAADAEANGLLTKQAVPFVRDVVYTASGAKHSYIPILSKTDASRFKGLEHPHYTMGDGSPELVDPNRWSGALGNLSDYQAAIPGGFQDDLWTGTAFPAYVDITSPFVRDFKGRAKTWGRLTLARLRATLIRTAGFEAQFIDRVGTKTTAHFAGSFERLRYGVNIWVGRDAREVQVRLAAKDWLPLTINALEWTGQWFEPTQQR